MKAYLLSGKSGTTQFPGLPSCLILSKSRELDWPHFYLPWFLSALAFCSCCFSFSASKRVLNMSSNLKNVSQGFSYFQTNHVSMLKFSISPTIKIPEWTARLHRLQSTCTYFLACFSWVRNQPTDQFQCLRNCHFVCFLQTIFSKNSNINLLQPISLGYHKKSSNCSFSFFFFSWL